MKHVVVKCSTCRDWIDEADVEFLNIEENFYGEDVLTFICPHCKKKSSSLRRGI